jgi:TetR/AcrR family transcriptional regulator, tetracycline repressor protein
MTSTQATTDRATTGPRTPLSRRRILEAALGYIDAHGLDALSMHKLGAALGVKGMSLYNHVANKHDLLDGVVELLWSQVEQAAPATPDADWRDGFRAYASALREVALRHPNAAPLIVGQLIMPTPALRLVQAHTAAAATRGVAQAQAHALLRTLTSHALGSALAEINWSCGRPGCRPPVSDLLRPGTPQELAGLAEVFCGGYDPDEQFQLGLDLMLRATDPP